MPMSPIEVHNIEGLSVYYGSDIGFSIDPVEAAKVNHNTLIQIATWCKRYYRACFVLEMYISSANKFDLQHIHIEDLNIFIEAFTKRFPDIVITAKEARNIWKNQELAELKRQELKKRRRIRK